MRSQPALSPPVQTALKNEKVDMPVPNEPRRRSRNVLLALAASGVLWAGIAVLIISRLNK